MFRRALLPIPLLLLASCSSPSASPATTAAPTPRIATATGTAATVPSSTASPNAIASVKEAGLGQSGRYVWATAVVHNNTQKAGQVVTVNFNVFDSKGTLLASGSTLKDLPRPNDDVAIGTQVDLAEGDKAARVEATVLAEDRVLWSGEAFPALGITAGKISQDYGAVHASFEVSNSLNQPLKNAELQVICRDAKKEIVGGGLAFPALIGPKGKVKVDVAVTTSGVPTACDAYSLAPMGWEGVEGAPGSPTPVASESVGTAEQAFKTWVDQFAAKDFAGQYASLVSPQQRIISREKYVECREAASPAIKFIKTLSSKDVAADVIPGTDVSMPSRLVKVQVSVNGVTVPVDSHMYQEGGVWKWAMTDENIKSCA